MPCPLPTLIAHRLRPNTYVQQSTLLHQCVICPNIFAGARYSSQGIKTTHYIDFEFSFVDKKLQSIPGIIYFRVYYLYARCDTISIYIECSLLKYDL